MFAELGSSAVRGPRVWLSRWYVGVLGVVGVAVWMPAWVRWLAVILWAGSTLYISRFYSSELLFYKQWISENPNPDHYRIANYGFCLLNAGRHIQAEDEFKRVLFEDPDNWRAKAFLQMFESNRAWTAKGWIPVGMICRFCDAKEGRMLRDGDTLSKREHDMYFLRICSQCGRQNAWGVLERSQS